MNDRLIALAIVAGWPLFVFYLGLPMLQDYISPLISPTEAQSAGLSFVIIVEGFISMLGIGIGSIAWAIALPELIFGSKFLN